MRVILALKKIKRVVKAFVQYIRGRLLSIQYLYLRPKTISEVKLEAHLLVVKKEVYASIAKVCVESFLFFHPNSRVVVHADSHTVKGLSKKLNRLILREKVTIELIQNEAQIWQDSKLDLILSLSDPKDFFMDADLKWNAPLPELKGITLFVNEFEFAQNPFYAPLVMKDWFKEHSKTSMKNTSFFYWSGYKPSQRDAEELELIMSNIAGLTSELTNGSDFNLSVSRISEQIALSLLVEKVSRQTYFLKDIDGFKDGSFVESSYFGATGATF